MLKHVASHVQPGARLIDTWSVAGYDDQLVFANPDGSLVVVIHNGEHEASRIALMIGDRVISSTLPADSFSTIVIPAA